MKSGQVVIIGRPNTGKSTLLNAILGQKVSITSPLPQTTRKLIRGVYEDDRGRLEFVDTPGVMLKNVDLLSKNVSGIAEKSLKTAGILLCLFDISRPKSDEDSKIIGMMRKSNAKKILIYNKIDKAVGPKDHLAEYNFLEEEFDRNIAISALKDKGVKGVINLIFELIEDDGLEMKKKNNFLIETNPKEFVAEIIREKAYLYLRREIPYSVEVLVNKIVDKRKLILVEAEIETNAERYKKMIIGKNGAKIKQIGSHARKELELMSGRKVFLKLEVVVDKHWMERY